jgi:hypothetical protein
MRLSVPQVAVLFRTAGFGTIATAGDPRVLHLAVTLAF